MAYDAPIGKHEVQGRNPGWPTSPPTEASFHRLLREWLWTWVGGNQKYAGRNSQEKILTTIHQLGCESIKTVAWQHAGGHTNFRPIRKLLVRGLRLGVNGASAHVPSPPGRGKPFSSFPAFRATQEVAPRRLRGGSTVIGAVSFTGVRVFGPLGFLCAAARLRHLRARAGSQAPESFPLPATGSPSRRDSQVGPVPPPSLPAAMTPPMPGPPAECAGQRCPWARAGRLASFITGPWEGLWGLPGSNPLVLLLGKLRHREGSQS